MTTFNIFRPKSKPRTIVTSRPIFQHASSFLNDDDDDYNDSDLKKSAPFPLFHEHHDHNNQASQPQPTPQRRLQLVLHSFNLLFTAISLSLFIAAIPIWDANFRHAHSIISGDYTDGLVLVPLTMSFIISTCLTIMEHTPRRYFRRQQSSTRLNHVITKLSRKPSMQPKTLVLLSLSVLLLLPPALTLSAINSLALAWRSPQRTKTGVIACNLTNILSRECQPTLYTIGGLQIAGIVVGSMTWCLWACVLVVSARQAMRDKKEKERLARSRRRARRQERRKRQQGSPLQQRSYSRVAEQCDTDVPRLQRAALLQGSRKNFTDQRPRREPQAQYVGAKTRKLHAGSPAVQLTSASVRPQETIQQWLSSRAT